MSDNVDEQIKDWITELLTKCKALDDKIEEAGKGAVTNTEKELHVRQLTFQRGAEGGALAELLKENREKENHEDQEAKLRD